MSSSESKTSLSSDTTEATTTTVDVTAESSSGDTTSETSTTTSDTTSETSATSATSATDDSDTSSEISDLSALSERPSVVSYYDEEDILRDVDAVHFSPGGIWAREDGEHFFPVPSLANVVLFSAKFVKGPELPKLLSTADPKQRQRVLTLLPLDMLDGYTVPILPAADHLFWKRMCLRRWPETSQCVGRDDTDTWKTSFAEHRVSEILEGFDPESPDLKLTVKLYEEHVHRLKIRRLRRIDRWSITVNMSSEALDDELDDFLFTSQTFLSLLNFEVLLANLARLRELDLAFSPRLYDEEARGLRTADFNSLFRGLKQPWCRTQLQAIRIHNGVVTNEQTKVLCDLLGTMETLRHLDLSFNRLDDDCCARAANILLSTSCPLLVLKLRRNRISDDGARSMADALSKNSKLEELDLSSNQIGDKGAEFFAEAFSKNSTLKKLDLSENAISAAGGVAFVVAVGASESIERLAVARNDLGKESGAKLNEALQDNTALLHLDMRYCGFSNEDEDQIHLALVRNRTLRRCLLA